MALSEIENQRDAGHIVLRHARGRTVAVVAVVLTLELGFLHALRPEGTYWRDAFGGLVGALVYAGEAFIAAYLAYPCFVLVVQAVRRIPLLQASEGGLRPTACGDQCSCAGAMPRSFLPTNCFPSRSSFACAREHDQVPRAGRAS
jgi:hypothetical protein